MKLAATLSAISKSARRLTASDSIRHPSGILMSPAPDMVHSSRIPRHIIAMALFMFVIKSHALDIANFFQMTVFVLIIAVSHGIFG